MRIRTLLYYIIIGFAASVAALVGAQYIMRANIKDLISGNEDLLKQYKLNNELVGLQKDLLLLDNHIKAALTRGDSTRLREFEKDAVKLREDIRAIAKTGDVQTTQQYIPDLDSLVNRKIDFSHELIDSFYRAGKPVPEQLIAGSRALTLSRHITDLAHRIDTSGRTALAGKVRSVDETGQRVLDWNVYVLVLVLGLLIALFLIIIARMKKQAELIGQLNTSEKKLKEAVLIKENFLANMSHEIRTPLNAILGYTNLLQKKKLDADTRLHISTVQQSGETLLSIVNDILDLSKIESGMMRIEKVPFNLKALVHSVTTMFHHRAEEKNIPLVVSHGPNVPETLNGDPTRLTQILVNLISNAFKFTEHGKVALDITASQDNDDHATITFRIMDTGIGIEPGKLETIFERFRQAEDSTTRHFGGTGLGLSIVRDLVYLQDGDIDVKSTPGEGTTVSVSIAYQIPAQRVFGEVRQEADYPPAYPTGLRVLIVEDHRINQGLITHLMEERGIDSRVAHNGREAIDILQKEVFDVVLMDIQMPEMDGYTAVREIRETLELTVPIVAMTAHAMEGEKEKCLNLGMNDHISKPVREHDLDRILSHYALNGKTDGFFAVPKQKNGYKVIDLDYMKEISNGDSAYEKLVTEQFLHLMPRELEALSSAATKYDPAEIRRIAHGMKTTISIMGLNRVLDESLDVLENENITAEVAKRHMHNVLAVCKEALSEAGQLYRQF